MFLRTSDPDRYSSLVEMFENATLRYADNPAFINMGEVMTYRQLEDRSRAFAAYLQNELGLKKGDRVALMMPNLLQYPIALFGVLGPDSSLLMLTRFILRANWNTSSKTAVQPQS